MVNKPWHPAQNAHPVAWALANGRHADEYGLILRKRTGPSSFVYELYDVAGNLVATFQSGDEAAAAGWERYLEANAVRHHLVAKREAEHGPWKRLP